jgi:hypothetical protein
MNKPTLIFTLVLSLILTACSGSAANRADPTASGQGGSASGGLSAPMQVAIGTIKLDATKNAVSAEQAKELLPLWETLQVLEASDTAATEEKDALLTQIQETMAPEQTQAITALNLTRRDMASILQSQVQTFGGTQNGATQGGATSNSNRRNAGGGNGFFIGGGPPPDGGGGFAGGGGGFQGQGSSQTQSNSSTSTQNSNRQFTVDPNRLPTPLIQAVIAYLKTKAGT